MSFFGGLGSPSKSSSLNDDFDEGSVFSDDSRSSSSTSQDPWSSATFDAGAAASFDTSTFKPIKDTPSSFIPALSQSKNSSSPSIDFGALSKIDPSVFAGGNSDLSYLFDEDYVELKKKTWGEQLVYLGGMAYLTGGFVGGVLGFREGWAASRGKPRKIIINTLLNSMGKKGALAANSLGVLAVMFSGFESIMYKATDEDQALNYVAAGALTGALYKSTRNLKQMGIWGVGLAAIGLGGVYATRQGVYGRSVQGFL